MTIPNISKALSISGYMSKPELLWLAEQSSKVGIVVEIGSWKGRSTRALADNCPGIVYAVDHWKGQLRDPVAAPTREIKVRCGGDGSIIRSEFNNNLSDLIDIDKVIPINHNSQDGVPTELEVVRDRVGLLFIDGDHSYEGCKSDIELFGPLLREGGILSGHDYNSQPRHSGVRQIVDELFGDNVNLHHTIWWVRV